MPDLDPYGPPLAGRDADRLRDLLDSAFSDLSMIEQLSCVVPVDAAELVMTVAAARRLYAQVEHVHAICLQGTDEVCEALYRCVQEVKLRSGSEEVQQATVAFYDLCLEALDDRKARRTFSPALGQLAEQAARDAALLDGMAMSLFNADDEGV